MWGNTAEILWKFLRHFEIILFDIDLAETSEKRLRNFVKISDFPNRNLEKLRDNFYLVLKKISKKTVITEINFAHLIKICRNFGKEKSFEIDFAK